MMIKNKVEFDVSYLVSLGWNDFFQESFDERRDGSQLPGRVSGQSKGHYNVQVSPEETLEAAITTKFHDSIKDAPGFPTVGDWVTLTRGQGNNKASIHRILSRKSLIQRRRSNSQQGIQLIAANVDFLLLVSSCNEEFDLARLGRYVALGRESGCTTVLILTKSDLEKNPDVYLQKFRSEFDNIEVHAISNKDPASRDPLQKFFAPGLTSILLGSSGVGKSTLTNFLLGSDLQKTGGLSSQAKGRHTTTARNLCFTRWGGLVIDTPGMQEISLVDPEENLQKNFDDIEEWALRCKFGNCLHQNEPGCAVLAARNSGELGAERWRDYLAAVAQISRGQKKKKR